MIVVKLFYCCTF